MPRSERWPHVLAVVVALLVAASAFSCRLFSREVTCRRDRDCPIDAGMPYCTSWHADAGVCTDDEEYDGDFLPPDAGPDAGSESPADAGTDAGVGDAG